jgi:hypothetical protein
VRAGPTISRERLADFAAVAVVSCDREQRTIDHAVWEVAVRRVAVTGVSRLVAALRLPSEPSNAAAACTTNLVYIAPLALVDKAGRYVVPAVPVDACDHPLDAAMRAVGGLGWRAVSVRRTRQMVSPEAYAAGCSMKYKDMPWLDARYGTARSAGGPLMASTPVSAKVCVYRVTGRDHEVGSFVRGFKLSPAVGRKLLVSLTRPGPTGACPDVRDFASVAFAGGPAVVVELGGCWRVDRPGGLGAGYGRAVGLLIGGS